MLDQRWYDKIAAAKADAEAAVIDAAAQDAAAADESLIAKIQEDIQIAQEVAAANLPTDVKVEILENQGVEPEIIDEVIDADATDAVAAYYGVDPYWLHDKRAAAAAEAAKTLARKATPAAKKALNAAKGLTSKADTLVRQNPFEAGIAAGATMGGAGMAVNRLRGKDKKSAYYGVNPYIDDKTAAGELPVDPTFWQRVKNAAGSIGNWAMANPYAAGVAGLGALGLGALGYAGYNAYQNKLAEEEAAQQAAMYGLGGGAGLGGLTGAGLGYLAGGMPGAIAGGLGGAALGGAAGYYGVPMGMDYLNNAASTAEAEEAQEA